PLELALRNAIANCRRSYCNLPLRQALRQWLPDKAGPLSTEVRVASVPGIQFKVYCRFILRTKCNYFRDIVNALGGCLHLRRATSGPDGPTDGVLGGHSASAISISSSDSRRWISLPLAFRLGNDLCESCMRSVRGRFKSGNGHRALDCPV